MTTALREAHSLSQINTKEDKTMTDRIKINFSLEALRTKRAELVRLNQKEYQTRGNTQRCQELWSQIEKIDDEIAKRFMEGEELK